MKKRIHFETMKIDQLEAELRQLNEVAGRLHREQKTTKKWIEEILESKRQRVAAEQEKDRQAELESMPDKINAQHTHEWGLFAEDMIARRNARLAARTDDGAKDHAQWRTDNMMWLTQADMQAGIVEKFAEQGNNVFVLADASNFKRAKDVITGGIALSVTKYLRGRNDEPIPVIKDVAMNDEWKEVMLGGAMAALEYAALIRKGGLQDQIKQAFDHAHVTAIIGEEDMLEHLKPIAAQILSKHGIRTTQELFAAAGTASVWATLERELDQHITLSPPRSAEEAYLRISVQYSFLAHAATSVGSQQVSHLHDQLAERRMARIPKRVTIDPMNIPKHLSHINASVFATPGLITAKENGRDVFLIKKADYMAAGLTYSPLFHGEDRDYLVTHERVAALLPDEPNAPPRDPLDDREWISGYIPTKEQATLGDIKEEFDAELIRLHDRAEKTLMALDEVRAFKVREKQLLGLEWQTNHGVVPKKDAATVVLEPENDDSFKYSQAPGPKVIGMPQQPWTPEWRMRRMWDFLYLPKDVQTADMQQFRETLYRIDEQLYPIDRLSDRESRAMPVMRSNPKKYLEAIHRATRGITRRYPRSVPEALRRIWEASSDAPASFQPEHLEFDRLIKQLAPRYVDMAPVAIADQEHAWLRGQLERIDPTLLAPNPNVTYAMEGGATQAVFVCRKEHVPAALATYVSTNNDEALDFVVNLNLQAEDKLEEGAWVIGNVPSEEQLELGLVHQEVERAFARLEARAATMGFDPDESAVWEQMADMIRSLQWRDGKREPMDPKKIGIDFTHDGKTEYDSYSANTPQAEISLDRYARHPAWLLHAVLSLLPVRTGHPYDVESKISASVVNKLHSTRLLWQPEEGIDPVRFIKDVVDATRVVTREYPRSAEEASRRIGYSYMGGFDETRNETFMRMKPAALAPKEGSVLNEHLEMLDPALLAENPDVTYTLPWGTNKPLFVCRKEHVPAQFIHYVDSDIDETLDLVVNLGLQSEHALEADAWVSGTLHSIEELERELFVQDFVADKFFPNTKDAAPAPTEEPLPASGNDDEPHAEPKPIPRTKQLRNVLLKNRWKATFTVDDRSAAPAHAQYASAEPGHYVLVSLPEAKLQVLISDDHSKGTFVLRNLINPEQFTKIGIDELLATYGATRVKFDKPAQFRSALETEIGEQIKDPITIYPVASSYPTPLDAYPNPEAFAALGRDFAIATGQAGKVSIDDLTVADFERIKSGAVRWSFGGVAGGASYLDRLATEFGMDANVLDDRSAHALQVFEDYAAKRREASTDPDGRAKWEKGGEYYENELKRLQELNAVPTEQFRYRERVLRLVLWDLSETYRTERSAMYAEKAKHGRWHSVAVRKSRNGKTNGNAEPTEAF